MIYSFPGAAVAPTSATFGLSLQRQPTSQEAEPRSASLSTAESRQSRPGGATLTLIEPNKAGAGADTEEAWTRIDTLLNQMRQLTLGAADVSTSSATTTARAISAYSEHADH